MSQAGSGGKKLGRPKKVGPEIEAAVVAMRKAGCLWRECAVAFGLDRSTLSKHFAAKREAVKETNT